MAKKLTQQEFLGKASLICENRIGLESFIYTRSNVPSIARCLIDISHPSFLITPNKVLNGAGCPECAGNKAKTLELVHREIQQLHGDKYTLTKNSKYLGTNTKMELFCNECLEPFYISPKKCKAGQGHRKCCREAAATNRIRSFEELIISSEREFGPNVFIYEKDTYLNWNTKVGIWCRIHGRFEKTPVEHLSLKYGCSECWELARGRETTRKFSEDFETLARLVHGDSYDYSKFAFVNFKTRGTIVCKKHGEFYMTPDTHINSGCGCAKCSHTFSRAQQDFTNFIESIGVLVERDYRLPSNKEVDVFIPELNLAFEYNGLRFHSDLYKKPIYHLLKTRECMGESIRLVHIFEDEWLKNRSVVENLIKTLVGKESLKYNARDCEFKRITWSDYEPFVDSHHLQGAGVAPSVSFGLFHSGDLISVMGFSPRDCKDGEVELVRFCSKGIVRGGFSKLLSNAKKEFGEFNKIVSFSDTRWSLGDVYRLNGFKLVGITKPDYWYVNRLSREDKRSFQRKYLPNKLEVFDETLSERANCAANGIYRIFDCGKRKWELSL